MRYTRGGEKGEHIEVKWAQMTAIMSDPGPVWIIDQTVVNRISVKAKKGR